MPRPDVLDRFPKARPELPPEYRALYAAHYRENRDGTTPASALAQRMERWMHRQVARDVQWGNSAGITTLELGAGTLNHLPYEPDTEPYDIVEPFHALYMDRPALARIRNCFDDIRDVPLNSPYHRVLSIATLEHLTDLPQVIAHIGLRLHIGGELRVAIPAEGTLLWRLGWRATTGREFGRRYGLDYGRLMAYEHVNTAAEVAQVLHYFFRVVNRRVLGVSPSWSLYHVYCCSGQQQWYCEEWAT